MRQQQRHRKGGGNNRAVPVILTLLAVFVIFVAGAWGVSFLRGIMNRPFDTFHASSIPTTEIKRDFTDAASTAATLPASLLDTDVLKQIRQGASFDQSFTKVTSAGNETRHCSMEGWVGPSRLAKGNQSENDRDILIQQQLLPECNKLVDWVNTREAQLVRRLVIVDMTGGIGVAKPEAIPSEYVADEIGLDKLKDSFDAGDSVELFGCKVSADRQVDCKQSKADKNNAFKSVEDVAGWLKAKSEDAKETSFYEAFVNIVDWFKVKGIQIPETKIISDDTENSMDTANFYELAKSGKLKKADDYPALFDKVLARKMAQLPDLSGVSVTLVGPPWGNGPVRDRVEQSMAFAKYAFGERMKANVQTRYR